MSVNEKMTAIANEVRTLSGATDKLNLDEMASHTKDANAEVHTQENLIRQIATALQGKTAGGDGTTIIEPLEVVENGTYTAHDGVDGYSPIVVDVPIPDGYIVPSGSKEIAENGSHNVTEYASVNVNVPIPDGYIVPNGTLDVTENGTYDVTEKAEVVVNVESSGGGNDEEIEALVGLFDDTTIVFESDRITKLVQYAFYYRNCTSISLPNLKSTATRVFSNCDNMVSLSIPNMTGATNSYMAAYCGAMTTADVRNASSISTYAFYGCSKLKELEFNRASSIAANAFNGCTNLATLILRRGSLVTLSATSAFTGTKIAGTGGYIYVPKTLDDGSDGVAAYQAASNWSTYSSKFRAIEDYPEICGGAS